MTNAVKIKKSLPIIWYDEYGFIPYNDVIYSNASPAFKTASDVARNNGSPYGILISTTPGLNLYGLI